MFAGKYKLDNLVAIVDYDKWCIDGPTNDVMPIEPLRAKWEAFGWSVTEIDGHNMRQIVDTLNLLTASTGTTSLNALSRTPSKVEASNCGRPCAATTRGGRLPRLELTKEGPNMATFNQHIEIWRAGVSGLRPGDHLSSGEGLPHRASPHRHGLSRNLLLDGAS